MECKKCHKSCVESELNNGLCSDCIKKYNISCTIQNKTAKNYRNASWIISLIIIVINMIIFITLYDFIILISTFVLSIVVWFVLYTASEIIQLLEDIKNK